MQFTVCRIIVPQVLCAAYCLPSDVQSVLCNKNCTVYCVLMLSLKYTACYEFCAVFSLQPTVYSMQCILYTIQCVVYSVLSAVYSVVCVVLGVLSVFYSIVCVGYSVLYVVYPGYKIAR